MVNGYVNIKEIITKSFFIPKYQRGYRWDKDNVIKLLDDIYEDKLVVGDKVDTLKTTDVMAIYNCVNNLNKAVFKIREDGQIEAAKQPYCIQPLVVCQNTENDPYIVIDGQQRLTTIIIILSALRAVIKDKIDGFLSNIKINITYETRQESKEYLNSIWENGLTTLNQKEDNIDFLYINSAYKAAFDWFSRNFKDISDDAVKIYSAYLKNILLQNTRFIWYKIETKETDPRQVFANFNTGKLPLTNAELIKALFMDRANYNQGIAIDDKRIVISEKWDEIENSLYEPDFWAFVPHPDQYEQIEAGKKDAAMVYDTRIDLIFDFFIMEQWFRDKHKSSDITAEAAIEEYIIYRKNKKSKVRDRYIFDEIDAWLKECLLKREAKDYNKVMNECWAQIRKVYLGLRELYQVDTISEEKNKNAIYNLVGLYIMLCNRAADKSNSYNVTDMDLYLRVYHDLAGVLNLPRNARKKKLLGLIKNKLCQCKIADFVKSVRHPNSKDSSTDRKTNNIVSLLITYNIAILNNSESIGERFNFLSFAKNSWEREHIFANKTDTEKLIENIQTDTTEDEKKAVLKILDSNSYVDYVYYAYICSDEFSYNRNDIQYDKKTIDWWEIEDNRDSYLKGGFDRFSDTSSNMLAKALEARNKSIEYLRYYNYIDHIRLVETMSQPREHEKRILYNILEEIGVDFRLRKYMDFSKNVTIEEILDKDSCYFSAKCDFLKEYKSETEDFSEENRKDFINSMFTFYQDQLRDVYMKRKDGVERADAKATDYQVKSYSEITEENWTILYHAFVLCKETLQDSIQSFFQEDFPVLLRDNGMGNMTLLTGKGGLNQFIGNQPFKNKKKEIHKAFHRGDFVPMGTILVFSDTYNDGPYVSNFWLPDSRKRYLEKMIETLECFFEERGVNNG